MLIRKNSAAGPLVKRRIVGKGGCDGLSKFIHVPAVKETTGTMDYADEIVAEGYFVFFETIFRAGVTSFRTWSGVIGFLYSLRATFTVVATTA